VNLQLILGAIFGGGLATLIATIAKIFDSRRKGKIENEDSALGRLETENIRAKSRADEAEKRADNAEAETAKYRKTAMKSEDLAALYRRTLIQSGVRVPKLPLEGTDHEQ
jgi:hypothetical protein